MHLPHVGDLSKDSAVIINAVLLVTFTYYFHHSLPEMCSKVEQLLLGSHIAEFDEAVGLEVV